MKANRLASVDILRDAVMVLMAIDHVCKSSMRPPDVPEGYKWSLRQRLPQGGGGA